MDLITSMQCVGRWSSGVWTSSQAHESSCGGRLVTGQPRSRRTPCGVPCIRPLSEQSQRGGWSSSGLRLRWTLWHRRWCETGNFAISGSSAWDMPTSCWTVSTAWDVQSRALHGAPDSEITREPERPVRVRYVFYHDHSGPGSERSPITRGRVGTVATVRHYLGIRGCLSICVIPEWFREDP